ncbi:Transcription repressor OFP4 [Bienertia sinuspersici]
MKPIFRASKTVKPCSSPTKSQTNTTNTSITNSKHPKLLLNPCSSSLILYTVHLGTTAELLMRVHPVLQSLQEVVSSCSCSYKKQTSVPNECIRRSGDFGVELLMFDELGLLEISSSTTDIIIDLKHHDNQTHEESTSTETSELELRPILTKLPTLKSRKPSLSDSFAIVKSSIDPHRDFKDSMMEMILENNLRGFKDLGKPLSMLFSLNCKEYHPLIVNAFEQIWLDVICST